MDEFLYAARSTDRARYGAAYAPPANFEHGRETRVAVILPDHGGDGEAVTVYETALPARFFRIKSQNVDLSTGSDMGVLAFQIARAVAHGMLTATITHGV